MKYYLTLFLMLFFITAAAIAGIKPEVKSERGNKSPLKNFLLTGTVEDAGNQEKLVCAKIEIEQAGIKIFTDLEGNFEISDLTAGDFTLKVSYISYCETEIHSSEISGKDQLTIKLKPL
jgi:hypothetical protein